MSEILREEATEASQSSDSSDSSDSNEMKIVDNSINEVIKKVPELPSPSSPKYEKPSEISSQELLKEPIIKQETDIKSELEFEESKPMDTSNFPISSPMEAQDSLDVNDSKSEVNTSVDAIESSIRDDIGSDSQLCASRSERSENNISIKSFMEMKESENGSIFDHEEGQVTEKLIKKEKKVPRKRSIAETISQINDEPTNTPDKKSAKSTNNQERIIVAIPNDSKRKLKDDYCWICHKEKSNISCKSCPRSFHFKCLPVENLYSGTSEPVNPKDNLSNNGNKANWVCSECTAIMKAEDITTQSSVLSHLSPHEFSDLLLFAVQTIKATADRSFHQPVSETVFPDYRNYIVHPMDFSTIEKNIKSKAYGCTEAMMADIKYIVHNCYIYNSPNHPLTKNANYFLKVAKNEMQEIEICPNCFRNFYTFKDKEWFTEPCARPHILVYAKMRGYPAWPAKVVRYDKEKNEVDVRFFGAHDRSWIPVDQCYLLTKPNSGKSKGSGKGRKDNKYETALNELEQHIKRLNELFPSKFHYAKSKEPINVNKLFICDGVSEEKEISPPLDDDRDSDLNDDDKLVIDETGDDLETGTVTNNDNVDRKQSPDKSGTASPSKLSTEKTDKFVNKQEAPIPKLTIPKSLKIPLRQPQALPDNKIPSSPKKEETPSKPVKKKSKTKKDKDKAENDIISSPTTPANKKSESKKKISIKGLETPIEDQQQTSQQQQQQPNKKSEEYEQFKRKYDFEKTMHKEQLKEMEHNHNLTIREMRESWIKEKERALNDLAVALEEKHRKEIEETKKKQWCSECLAEAMYFCCWNTSYCSLSCQKAHWPKHAIKCQQQQHNRQQTTTSSTTGSATSQPTATQQPQQQHLLNNTTLSSPQSNSAINRI